MKYAGLLFLISFAFRLPAQPQNAPLPKGVKSVTTYCYGYIGNDSMELARKYGEVYDRKGNKTMSIASSDTTFYTYDKRGNKTMEVGRDTTVYKYDRKGREIERGIIRGGVYTCWYTAEYDQRGRVVRRVYDEIEEETFSYAKNGWITMVVRVREADGSEWWLTEVVNEKNELMKSVSCSRANDTAQVERRVDDSTAIRKVGDTIYTEYYSGSYSSGVYLRTRDVSNARGTVVRSEWTSTANDYPDSCITYYDLDNNGHWATSRTYIVDRRTGAFSGPEICTYTYDAQNRPLSRSGRSQERWTYDAAGRLTEHSTGDDRMHYSYNSTGQCIEVLWYRKGRLIQRTVTRIEFYR